LNYLTYRQSDGYVVAISETEPAAVEDGYAVAQSDHFQPGDEFEYYIKLYVDEIKDGQVRSHAAVRQAPPAQELLRRLDQVEKAVGVGLQAVSGGLTERLAELESRLEGLDTAKKA
jgi:hypothetical protein